jgi:hypothetical protein
MRIETECSGPVYVSQTFMMCSYIQQNITRAVREAAAAAAGPTGVMSVSDPVCGATCWVCDGD